MTDPLASAAGALAPREFSALVALVAASRHRLPKRLAQAAAYAVAHPDEVALGTAASISASAEVQPSTLVRLAQHLGYQGFTDFQSVFRDRLKSRASDYGDRLRRLGEGATGSSSESLIGGFIAAARASLDSFENSLQADKFSNCVNILAEAETIYLIGRRRAYPLVACMAYGFAKLGLRAILVDSANGIDTETVAMAGRSDAAVACSFSPYAPEAVAQAEAFTRNGAPLVAITDSAHSPMAALAADWVEVAETDFAGFRSLAAGMTLAIALPVAVAERRQLSAVRGGEMATAFSRARELAVKKRFHAD